MLLQGFPATGVTVFGSQLHTHGTGARVTTRHVRNGVELAELNRDNHYSTHFQVYPIPLIWTLDTVETVYKVTGYKINPDLR